MKTLRFILPILCFAFLFSCNDSESGGVSKDAPTMTVRLVDTPGDFEAVNVEVIDVMIKMDNSEGDTEEEDEDSGWISLESNSKTINLLELTGGVNEVLVDRFPIPVGTLKQMRLVLGDGNTIVIKNDEDEDVEHALKTPSGQQSGLKLKVDAVIEEGFTYDYIIDFDVEKSIVIAGNSGNIILKPVLYVSTEVTSGIIEGTVSPSDVSSVVSVLVDEMDINNPDDDFIITANTDENRAFALWGVPGGTYQVIITPPADSGYAISVVEDVLVENGQITDIGLTELVEIGSITGKITNAADAETASVMVDDVEVSVDVNNDTGVFLLENIPVGTYTVKIIPTEASGFALKEIADQEVTKGITTDLGDIILD